MSVYTVGYDFAPGDKLYVLDGASVKSGTCIQVSIDIAQDSTLESVDNVQYLTLLDCDMGTIFSFPTNTFATITAALNALTAKLAQSC